MRTRRQRLTSKAGIVAVCVILAGFSLPTPRAQAFDSPTHERIVRDALAPDGVDPLAFTQILNGPPPGGGAVGSDLFPSDTFRHLDNAVSPAEICARAQQAWNVFSPSLFNGAQPAGPGYTVLANGPAARSAFGGLAHAVEDFYSHSNWVETNIEAGQPDTPGPQLFPTCDPASMPPGLHTGYFSLVYGPGGCPFGGPPPGYQECHSTLNKDSASSSRGKTPVPGTNMTEYDLAVALATQATEQLYEQIRNMVVDSVNTTHPDADGECVAHKLFDTGLAPCARDAQPLAAPGGWSPFGR
jgi:hypothetical protein